MPPPANQAILDEVNKARLWLHAKKTRPIWAKRIEQDETVKTLEGVEKAPARSWICRGEVGEVWPQTDQRLHSKYAPTDEVDAGGWRKFEPRCDAEGVMAAQIAHAFSVEAQWGALTGKRGDYLVKNFEDHDAPYPDDVWIVDQALFHATYEPVETK